MSSVQRHSHSEAAARVEAELENIRRQLQALESDLIPVRDHTGPTIGQKPSWVFEASEQEITNEASVDLAMRIMDQRHRTQFYGWIRDEKNVDAIAHHLNRLVPDMNAIETSRGLRWLFEHWSMNAVSTLLIKLFYEQGLGSEHFAALVHHLCLGRAWPYVLDLISTLLIGEDAQMTAKFLSQVTKEWSDEMVLDLVYHLSTHSRWTMEFQEAFVEHFAGMQPKLSDAERIEMMDMVRKMFKDRATAMENMPQDKSSKFYGLSHRQFSKSVLERVLTERHRLKANCNQMKTAASEVKDTTTSAKGHRSRSSVDLQESLTSPTKYH